MTQQLHELRASTCVLIADALADAGRRLWVGVSIFTDRRAEGMALVIQMAGELGQGAVAEFRAERWYAGSALVRQLFETQYLLAHFVAEPAAAEKWLVASRKQLDRHFRPGQMRTAGDSSAVEYRRHCSWGGHPDPSARWLLPEHRRFASTDVLWIDLAQHLTDTWLILMDGLKAVNADEQLLPDPIGVSEKIARWIDTDPLSRRIKLPTEDEARTEAGAADGAAT